MTIVDTLEMSKCYGCGACKSICPKNALYMEEDEKGFLIPQINRDLCIDCGLCVGVCPALQKSQIEDKIQGIYAYAGNQALLRESSSGGVFTTIAEYIFAKEGVVFGAAWQKDFSVRHIMIDDPKYLDKLRLSKYVQSDQAECYREVKDILKTGRHVLYTGTPCQIAGLRKFLNVADFPNLLTLDLLCHGIPPYKLLKEYLNDLYGLENVKNVFMRRKTGWTTCLDVELNSGDIIRRSGKRSVFIKAFLSDIALRNTCYTCAFAAIPRQGDITIGDMWHAKALGLGKPYEDKSSIVIVNNEKGQQVWSEIINNNQTASIKDISATDIKKLNPNIFRPNSRRTANVDKFWQFKKFFSFEKAVLKTLHKSSVGLILHASDNYGSCATNMALYRTIEQLGHVPCVLDTLVPPSGVSAAFMKASCNLSSSFAEAGDYKILNYQFDSFVVGSDYSFNISIAPIVNRIEYFLMAFVDDDKKKIAYAPSLGTPDVKNDLMIRDMYKYFLSRFQYLSFREKNAVEICKQYFELDSQLMIDPVFLIKKEVFQEFASKSQLKHENPYIAAYILDHSQEKIELIRNLAKKTNLPCIIIPDCMKCAREKVKYSTEDNVLDKLSFEDFISYILNAKYIITDSFHGTCFSVIFKIPYIAIKNRNRKRFDTLAEILDPTVPSTQISIYDSIAEINKAGADFKIPDFALFDKNLARPIENGIFYLQAALNIDSEFHKKPDNYFNIDFCKLWRHNRQLKKEVDTLNSQSAETSSALNFAAPTYTSVHLQSFHKKYLGSKDGRILETTNDKEIAHLNIFIADKNRIILQDALSHKYISKIDDKGDCSFTDNFTYFNIASKNDKIGIAQTDQYFSACKTPDGKISLKPKLLDWELFAIQPVKTGTLPTKNYLIFASSHAISLPDAKLSNVKSLPGGLKINNPDNMPVNLNISPAAKFHNCKFNIALCNTAAVNIAVDENCNLSNVSMNIRNGNLYIAKNSWLLNIAYTLKNHSLYIGADCFLGASIFENTPQDSNVLIYDNVISRASKKLSSSGTFLNFLSPGRNRELDYLTKYFNDRQGNYTALEVNIPLPLVLGSPELPFR